MKMIFLGVWKPGQLPKLFEKDHGLHRKFWETRRPENSEPKNFKVTIEELKKPRSNDQNAYLHWLFDFIAVHSGQNMTPEEIKSSYKYKFLIISTKPTIKVRSTKDLSTKEMTNFLEWIWADALEYFGLYCPRPNEIDMEEWKN